MSEGTAAHRKRPSLKQLFCLPYIFRIFLKESFAIVVLFSADFVQGLVQQESVQYLFCYYESSPQSYYDSAERSVQSYYLKLTYKITRQRKETQKEKSSLCVSRQFN